MLRRKEVEKLSRGLAAFVALSACAPAVSAPPATDVVLETGDDVAAPREVEPPRTAPNDEAHPAAPIVWSEDLDASRLQAFKQSQPILVFVRADWSTASIEMERKVLLDPAILRAARPFVTMKLDVTTEGPKTGYWMTALNVETVPAIVMMETTGSRHEVVAGFVEATELSRALNAFVEAE